MVEQAHCKCIRKDTNKNQYLYLRNEDRNKNSVTTGFQLTLTCFLYAMCSLLLQNITKAY